jgi:hypothetical protein
MESMAEYTVLPSAQLALAMLGGCAHMAALRVGRELGELGEPVLSVFLSCSCFFDCARIDTFGN